MGDGSGVVDRRGVDELVDDAGDDAEEDHQGFAA